MSKRLGNITLELQAERVISTLVSTDVFSTLQETGMKVFFLSKETEYNVIRWYNDSKALVLFTGCGAFFMHNFLGGRLCTTKYRPT